MNDAMKVCWEHEGKAPCINLGNRWKWYEMARTGKLWI